MTLPFDMQVWTTGMNYAGYLPNPDDVRVFATQEQARGDVADRIDEWAEAALEDEMALADVTYDTAEEFDNDSERSSVGATAQAEAVRHNTELDYAQSFSVQVDNSSHQPPIFWAQPATVGEYFGGATDSPEYMGLEGEIIDAEASRTWTPDRAGDRNEWPREDLVREHNEIRQSRIDRGLPVLPLPTQPRITP